jgi:hypothetical protein
MSAVQLPQVAIDRAAERLADHDRTAGDDLDRLVAGISRTPLESSPPTDQSEDGALEPDLDVDDFLALPLPEYRWLVPDLLEVGDRLIVTGYEGKGKSTLLRQIAMQMSSGSHPFTGDDIDPVRVLMVDLENPTAVVRRQLPPLRAVAGDRYEHGMFRIHLRPQGLDLCRLDDQRWLAERISINAPQVLVIGPLYKMQAGDPKDEQTARAVAACIDWLRATYEVAVIIEAHAPYGEGAKARRPIRPYGASLWSRWPEFGVFLDGDSGRLEHWRGQREPRAWPVKLVRSAPWPWMVDSLEEVAPSSWDGPTHCMDAIAAYLAEHPDEEVTKSSLPARLRAAGAAGYRDRTVADSLVQLARDGRISARAGSRNSTLYRHLSIGEGPVGT